MDINSISASFGITFGASCPYSVGRIGASRVGFADIPMLRVEVFCKPCDIDALVPIARQAAFREAVSRGLDVSNVTSRASVSMSNRKRKVVDTNRSSKSFGKNKMLSRQVFSFEMPYADFRAFESALPKLYTS